jgi:anti-sigma factor RsiW
MRCDQAQELITARLDNELSADEHRAIEAHLHTCERCQRALTAESRLKQQLKLARQEVTAPAALRRELESAIASRRPALAVTTAGGFAWWFSLRNWRPAFAVALLVIAIAALFFVRSPQQDLGMAVLDSHRNLLSGKTALVRYDDANRLRQELSRAVRDRFAPIALDLSMMKLYPVSGFVQKIGDREVLVTVYQGAGPAITCFTLLGSESDAPERAQHFYDADMKLNFYSFSQDGINAVLHSEGNIICILVSKMSPADILALLRGKSAHA